jgi:hypothetical protein
MRPSAVGRIVVHYQQMQVGQPSRKDRLGDGGQIVGLVVGRHHDRDIDRAGVRIPVIVTRLTHDPYDPSHDGQSARRHAIVARAEKSA